MNFEAYPKRLMKSPSGDAGKCTYAFGAYDELNDTQGLDIKTFKSSVFEQEPLPVEELTIVPRIASNTFRCSSAAPPSDPAKSEKNREHAPSNSDIFGPPIPEVSSCPVEPHKNTSTIFKTDYRVEYPKRTDRTKTHTDTFKDGSYMMTKESNNHEPRQTNTFQSSKGLQFSETNYPERAQRRIRTCSTQQNPTEMGSIMRGHLAEPFYAEVNNKRSSNTFDSQILGRSSHAKATTSAHRRTGVSYSNFQTAGCTFPTERANDVKVYSTGSTSMVELKPRSALKHEKTSTIGYTENVNRSASQVSMDCRRPISRSRSRITQSSVFAHLSEPTPNCAKKGYGRITESSIFP